MAESKTDPNQHLSIEEIVALLRKTYANQNRKAKLSFIFLFCGLLLFGISLFTLVDSEVYFSADVKTGVFLFLTVVAASTALLFYRRTKLTSFNVFYDNLFKRLERKQVHSAVDLYLNPEQQTSKFYLAAIQSNIKGLNFNQFRSEVRSYSDSLYTSKHFKRSGILILSGILFLAFLGISSPVDSQRTLTFWKTYTQPNPFTFSIIPGDTTIEHGSAIQPGVKFENNTVPDKRFLAFKTEVEEEYRTRPLRVNDEEYFLSEPIELTNNITYHIEMDGFKSESYRIDVQLQPRFDELIVLVEPPSYTGLSERRFEYPFSEINFYSGSAIRFRGSTNKELNSAEIKSEGVWEDMDGDSDQRNFSFQINPDRPDTITFNLIDSEGLKNRNPFRTVINLREDQYPSVSILEPTGTVLETEPKNLNLFYQATDDFGLTRAELRWELQRAFVDEPVRGSRSLERPRNGRTESYLWELADLQLRPRDEVTFRIRVWDNDEVSGYKWSESNYVMLKVPSLADYFEDLDSRERDVQGDLDQISDNFRNMEREYEEFLERLRQNPDGGFEEQQIMEEIKERQDQIDEAVKRMNEQFEQLRSEMQQNDRTSEETRRAYRELQQLMQELDDPALREAMEQMQKALENMSPQEIEQALQNMDFNEQLYRERLERTVELFKRLKMNSDLDKLARQYEDLAERISPQDDQTMNQLDNELESVSDDLESLENQLDELDSNPPARSEETLRNLKEQAKEQLQQVKEQLKELQQDTQNSSGEGENAPTEEIQQQQEQISENFRKEAEKFRSSIQQMGGQQLQVNILALQRSLYTLLELSHMQEYLTKTASETRNRSQGFVEIARTQNNVRDQFSLVSDTLFQISKEIPGIPNQINRKKAEVERTIGRAMDEMVERSQRGATVTTRETLGGINDLTSMIASLIDQLMDQQGNGGGGGMSMEQMVEQLQKMSGDQLQLNQQLQDLINDVQGERLTRDESDRFDQLARQQNEIRRQLQELQRRGALNPGDRSLSEMERMIEQMEESINEMRGGITDPLMVQRQQNILSRMLETEESLQQRGESDEREGTSPVDYDRTLPPDMTLEELQQEIRSRLQDPNYTRFTEQYQRLIERYFEQLRRFEDRPVRQ
jgi:hypothetical protein